MTIRKALLAAAFILLLGLPACSPNWVIKPFSEYLKKNTGVELTTENIYLGVNPLHLESTGIQLTYKNGLDSWEAKIPDLRVTLGWTLSWEDLPWPKVFIKKVFINQPSLTIRYPTTAKGADWTTWLRKGPVIKEIEVNDLKGRLEIGTSSFQLAPGTQVLASYSPEQGGKIDYRLKHVQGGWSAKKLRFQARSQGSIEWSWQEDQPRWTGSVNLSQADLSWEKGKISELSGAFTVLSGPSYWEIAASSSKVAEWSWLEPDLYFQGRGITHLSGALKINKKEILLSEVSLQSEDFDFHYKQKDRWMKGRTKGQIRISGPYLNPAIKGRLLTWETALHLSPVLAQGLEADVVIQGRFPDLSLQMVKAKADRIDCYLSDKVLSIIHPETRFTTLLGGNLGRVDIKDIWLKTENWGTHWGDLSFRPSQGPAPSG
ncbi:MAG: hypothetical protein C0407_07915, partial [Desulfobacca sp.]|nr:hypothetical protein [Desulfobacca sp.]